MDDATTRPTAGATIAPWLSVADATRAVAYYGAAFGAVELDRLEEDDGAVAVAQLSVAGAAFWVQHDLDASPEALDGRSSVRMILTVDDPDAVFERAVAAGATVVAPVHEDHGWRVGRVVDPSGHQWEIAKRLAMSCQCAYRIGNPPAKLPETAQSAKVGHETGRSVGRPTPYSVPRLVPSPPTAAGAPPGSTGACPPPG